MGVGKWIAGRDSLQREKLGERPTRGGREERGGVVEMRVAAHFSQQTKTFAGISIWSHEAVFPSCPIIHHLSVLTTTWALHTPPPPHPHPLHNPILHHPRTCTHPYLLFSSHTHGREHMSTFCDLLQSHKISTNTPDAMPISNRTGKRDPRMCGKEMQSRAVTPHRPWSGLGRRG